MPAHVAALMLFLAATAVEPLMERIDRGRDALREKKYVEAEVILGEVLAETKETGDASAAARALFFLGLIKHEQADQAKADAAPTLRREAIRLYDESLQHYPNSRSTLGNLAELYAAERNYDAAKHAVERAMKIDTPSRLWAWFEQLGDYASAQGKHEEAAKRYADALHSTPNPSASLRQKFITSSLAAGKDSEDLIPQMWGLLKSERSDTVMNLVFDALKAKDLDRDARQALFGILTYGLARQDYTPSELSQIGVAERLQELSAKPRLANEVDAIYALYRKECSKRELFLAWPTRIDDDDIPSDLSPRTALGDLAIAVGRRAYHDRAYDVAAPCLELGVVLGHENDLELYADLAALYFEQNRQAEIEPRLAALEERLEAPMTSSHVEGPMVVSSDPEALYNYHRKLGSLYLQLTPDANTRAHWSAAAVRHLERSLRVAATITRPHFRADVSVKRLLGDAYERLGRRDDSTNARLDAATMFVGEKDFASARDMIRLIPPSAIDSDEERKRYSQAVEPLVTFHSFPIPKKVTVTEPATVKGCIVVLSTIAPSPAHEDARATLQKLGVKVVGRTVGNVIVGGDRVLFMMRTSG